MKVNLDKNDCKKLANAVKRETAYENIQIMQRRENKEMKPSFWNMLPFIMLLVLVIFTFIVMISQYGG